MATQLTERYESEAKGVIAIRENILGVGVSAVNIPLACRVIDGWIANDARTYVCVSGAHGLILCQQDKILCAIHNDAGLVTPDGMPLVWLLKLAGHTDVDRVYGPDLMLAVFGNAVKQGHKHFLYGATPETVAVLSRNLVDQFPGADIVGTFSPAFRPLTETESNTVVATINGSGADIVWVGLSTPKQEYWMSEFRSRLDAPVLIGVGAAFDFHAGGVRQAPRFIQRSGFEWLFRLLSEPRRLWRRYAVMVPLFLWLVFCQKSGLRRFSIES